MTLVWRHSNDMKWCWYWNDTAQGMPSEIDLFHNNFSPSGKQPELRKLAHEL